MRADRLLSVLLLLQANGRMTTLALAERLEVSRRTIHRDLEALEIAGVPVVVERGPHGGASLIPGYRTDLTGLTETEIEALLGLASGSVAAHLGLRPELESASRKLVASRPGGAGRLRLQERVLIDSEHWWSSTSAPAHLGRIQDAVLADRRLRLRYRRGEETVVVREVEPYGLVLKSGTWYLLAGRDGELRTYRISRVEEAEVLEATFRRPEGFDLDRAWRQHVEDFRDRGPATVVRVRLRPGGSGTFLRTASEHLRGRPTRGRATLVFPSEAAAAAFLAGHVEAVALVSPASVRARLAAIGRTLVTRYGQPA